MTYSSDHSGDTPRADGTPVPPPSGPNRVEAALAHETTIPMVIYALYLIGIFTGGLAAVIAVILAYVNRGKAYGTWLASHYQYQIRTFWIGLLYSVIGFVLTVLGIGFVILLAVLAWTAVRGILGILRLSRREAMPDPTTWLW